MGWMKCFNSNARMREIVVHAASYVSPGTINKLGRIGCSFGCPAVSPEVSDFVINKIKGKNVLFINLVTIKATRQNI